VVTDDDEPVDYDFGELDELAHTYAVTIHRSQGSEYPAVVIARHEVGRQAATRHGRPSRRPADHGQRPDRSSPLST
jgi:hypothetical protein